MGTPTIPLLSAPIVLASGDLRRLTVTYTTAGATASTVAAGTYYLLGSGASPCILDAIADQLTADDPGSGSWTVTLNSGRKLVITRTGGTDTATAIKISLQTSYGDSVDYGFATSTQALTTQAVTATYRPRHIWCPEEADYYGDLAEEIATTTTPGATPAGLEVLDVLGTITHYSCLLPAVPGALVLTALTSQADHAGRVSGLATSDPHAALESWLVYARSLCDGITPVIRWTPDVSSLGSGVRQVYLPGELYVGVREWGERLDAPTQWQIQVTTRGVAS